MSSWLKRRLLYLAAVAGLVVALGTGRDTFAFSAAAPSKYTTATTPEDLAHKVALYFWSAPARLNYLDDVWLTPDDSPYGLISSNDVYRVRRNGIRTLIGEMRGLWVEPEFEMKRQEGATSSRVVVEVDPRGGLKSRTLVCVKEDGNWKLDLIATYLKWANIPEAQGPERVSKLTGFYQDGPVTPETQNRLCQYQLQQMGLAFHQYLDDYDAVLPRAQNWQEALKPYVMDDDVFHCPTIETGRNRGYALNNNVSGKNRHLFAGSPNLVLVYESSHDRENAHGAGELLAFRHPRNGTNGANYLFFNDQTKWLPAALKATFNLGKAPWQSPE